MMMNLATLIVGVMAGTLAASVVVTVVCIVLLTNKKVMRAYMKWAMKMSAEITDMMFDKDDEEQ